MKKKWLIGILSGLCALTCVLGFSSCADGKSAYQIWLDNGHTGTEAEFLDWLKGLDGKSAYQIWLDNGHTGTKTEFLDWLKGLGSEEGTQGLHYQRISGKDEYRVIGIGLAADYDIVIPATYNGLPVTEIGDKAFFECSSLTSITIPNSVTSIGENAFAVCSDLAKVNYTGTIDGWAQIEFGDYGSSNPLYYAKKLYINDVLVTTANITTATKISDYAFYNCTSLTEIVIPDSVTSIGDYAFYNCTSLTKVNCTGTIDDWAQIEFGDYDSNPLYYAKRLYINDVLVTTANITTATKISDRAFRWCDSLAEIVIPDSVTSIGNLVFQGCSSLTSITVDNNNTSYKSIDGNLYSKDGKTLIQYATGKTATDFTIPDSVTSIGEDAFYNCTSLTSIVIPDGVTSIGTAAFFGCTSLTEIVIPDSVTSIGRYAVCDSSSLTIYCEAESQPSGWVSQWNYLCGPVYWYSETEPTISGNYWHYVDGVVTKW